METVKVTETVRKRKAPNPVGNQPPRKKAKTVQGTKGQNSVRARVTHASLAPLAKEVIKSIALPGIKSRVRFASAFTTGDTSIATLKQPVTIRFTPPALSAETLDTPQSTCAFVFRDPVRNMVVFDANPAGTPYGYLPIYKISNNGIETVSSEYYGAAGPIPIAYMSADPTIGSYEPHGQKMSTGLSNGNKTYIWCQADYFWELEGNANSSSLRIQAYRWTPRGEVFVGSFSETDISGGMLQGAFGYVRFEVYKVDANSNMVMTPITFAERFKLKFTGGKSVWAHKCLPSYEDKVHSVEKVRIHSQGLLFTNTTPAIARGGKIATKQLPGDEPWYEYAHGGYDKFSKLVNVDLRDASNGAYAYLKPTALTDFEMTDNVDISPNDDLLCFSFDLDSVRAYIGYYAVLPSADGQSAQLTSLTNIEFESDDQWYEQDGGAIDPKLFEDALHQIVHIPQYDENPLHLGNMMAYAKNFAGKVAKFIGDYGPTAIKIAETVGPILAAL